MDDIILNEPTNDNPINTQSIMSRIGQSPPYPGNLLATIGSALELTKMMLDGYITANQELY